MSGIRSLHLRGALGAVRREMWEGREHLVIPVVALQEAVIHAVNAKTAEYVPSAALTASQGKWNGHPLVVGHPVRDGKQISAHSPEVLARHGFGFIRQAVMTGKRLGMEAMVDPARLKHLKQDQLLADLEAGKPVEVSVGAFVNTNDTRGEFGGKTYNGEWTSIEPDHLAFLPGGVGACSLEMGCGAHRAAEAYLVTAEEFEALGGPGSGPQGSQSQRDKATAAATTAKAASDKARASGKSEDHERAVSAHRVAAGAHAEIGNKEQADKHQSSMSFHEGRAKALKTAGGPGSGPHVVGDRVRIHQPGNESHGKIGIVTHVTGESHSVSTPKTVSSKGWKGGEKMGISHSSNLRAAETKGTPMSAKSLKERILALFDTAEEAASEEAAELVAYSSMRVLLDSVGDQYDAASSLINELIADEEENPTNSPAQERAEEEVEDARLDAIRMHCYSMIAALQSICNACSDQQMPDVSPADPRYMEQFKALIGKAISAKNAKTIQAAHDSSHDVHTQTVALGAECNGMKLMAAKMEDCPTCEGTGQVKKDDKQEDCPTCKGEGQIKAAEAASGELKAACRCEEAEMDRKTRIAALLGHEPIKAWATEKSLEALDDKQLETLEGQVKKQQEDLKAAQDKATEVEAKLKAAEAAQIPAEELTSLRALSAEKQQRDAAEKADLVTKLVAASKALTKEQLEAKSLDELKTLAAFAKVQATDFSIKGMPVQRAAQGAEDYTPPNPYAPKDKAAPVVN